MSEHPVYRFDDFLVDPEAWKLCRSEEEIHLEPVVLRLLIYLIENRDRLVTRHELMDTVWGETVISESALSKAVARLRKALDDDPAAPRYLETVHSQGYRFVAAVEEAVRPAHALREDVPPSAVRRVWIRRVAAVVMLIVLALVWDRVYEPNPVEPDEIQSLAVLPLGNLTGDPGQDYYVEGLQEILITELSKLGDLRVTSRQSTKRYRDSQLSATEIASELGVDALVEGSLLRHGSDVEVSIQLIDGQSDTHIWAERYARETPYVLDLVSNVAQAIGEEVVATGGLEWPERAMTGPVDPRAIDAYSLGLTHLDRTSENDIRSAIALFEEVVSIEPGFALAWGHLAAAHAMNALYGYAPPSESTAKANAASLKAIESDDEFYIGHSALGWGQLWAGNIDAACTSFKEALRLNPSAPYALHGDADCLMLDGRMDESIARTRELLLVGPFSAMHNRPLAYHLYLARRYDEAIEATSAMQTRVPLVSMHWLLSEIYWAQGLFDEAIIETRRELEQRGDTVLLAALEEGLAAGGPAEAMRAIAEAQVVRAGTTYVDPFRISETFARAGAVDEALQWLGKAIEYGSYELIYTALLPNFDTLRDDPRFHQLEERVYRRQMPVTPRPEKVPR